MKHVLVTGASSGIGLHITKELIKQGHFVWAGTIESSELDLLEKEYPKNIRVLRLDVTSEKDIDNAFSTIKDSVKILERDKFVLINNAGVAVGGALEGIPMETWKRLFEVNFFGVIRLTQKFLPLLRANHGRVINIGSILGRIGFPNITPYCSSKFALRGFTDCLRREMLDFDIKVVLIEAGAMKTNIWKKSIEQSIEIKSNMSGDLQGIYQRPLDEFLRAADKIIKYAVPVEWITNDILSAVESTKPKSHYQPGKGGKLQVFLEKMLPATWLDSSLKKQLRGRTK